MTPDEYLATIGDLIAQQRYEEAVQIAKRYSREILPKLDAERFFAASSLMEMADRAVEVTETAQAPIKADDRPRRVVEQRR